MIYFILIAIAFWAIVIGAIYLVYKIKSRKNAKDSNNIFEDEYPEKGVYRD